MKQDSRKRRKLFICHVKILDPHLQHPLVGHQGYFQSPVHQSGLGKEDTVEQPMSKTQRFLHCQQLSEDVHYTLQCTSPPRQIGKQQSANQNEQFKKKMEILLILPEHKQ